RRDAKSHRDDHRGGKNRADRRRQNFRFWPRSGRAHPHRRDRCCGPLDPAPSSSTDRSSNMTLKKISLAGLVALPCGFLLAAVLSSPPFHGPSARPPAPPPAPPAPAVAAPAAAPAPEAPPPACDA